MLEVHHLLLNSVPVWTLVAEEPEDKALEQVKTIFGPPEGTSPGVAQAAYLLWALLATGCAAVSGGMLITAEREVLPSQAWLAAICFGLWSILAALTSWGSG
jgi:hypothetical protein